MCTQQSTVNSVFGNSTEASSKRAFLNFILDLAASTLLLFLRSLGNQDRLSTCRLDGIVRGLECLVRYDAVDFYTEPEGNLRQCIARFSLSTNRTMFRTFFLPVKIRWKDNSTLVASSAEVSINERPFSAISLKHEHFSFSTIFLMDHLPANCLASSVGTALKCLKSLLFPTSMITIFESAWSRSSFNQRPTLS